MRMKMIYIITVEKPVSDQIIVFEIYNAGLSNPHGSWRLSRR